MIKDNVLFQSEKHPLVAEEFSSFEDYCLSLIHEKAYEVAASLARGKTVLDVGCNSGYGTARIAGTALHATGIDVSARSIDAATLRYSVPNAEFRLVDGGVLPFANGAYDCVFSFQVIEHVEDRGAYLAELRRVLKETGFAVFTTPNRRIRLDPGMSPWNPFHVTEFSAEELLAELSPHFAHVGIFGLFGVSEIYDTEIRRVGRAKARARSRLRRIAKAALFHLLSQGNEEWVYRLSRTLKSNWKRYGAPPDFPLDGVGTFSTKDLFYRADGLDQALDLMAVCFPHEASLEGWVSGIS